MRNRKTKSRRELVVGVAITCAVAGLAFPTTGSAAQQKIRKEAAKYQYAPKGQQRCQICLQFQPPDQCKIVEGPISPKGWCQYFAAKENAE
jgi:hypothetical protein